MDVKGLTENLGRVTDPRRDYGNKRHKLIDILVIGLCSVVCAGEGFEDMEEFGEGREEWLRTFLELPNAIPSSDTFRRVFECLDSKELMKCLQEWLESSQAYKSGGRLVNIDGKTSKGSGVTREGKSAIHVVSAWVHENGMILGQLETEEKSNEITAVPLLLDMIDVRGDIVTIDAMGCQKEIAAKIREKKADYVLAVKDNHPTLHEDIRAYFEWAECKPNEIASAHWRGEIEKDHGRIERREITAITDIGWLRRVEEWKDLQTIIRYRCTRIIEAAKTQTEQYFISSFDTSPEQFGYLVRNHWSIENRLHWLLDVAFREDASTIGKGNSPANLSVLRKIALSRLNGTPTPKKISTRRKMIRAGLNLDFLNLVIFGR
jgi:predicted transposase YbfD/YdcC